MNEELTALVLKLGPYPSGLIDRVNWLIAAGLIDGEVLERSEIYHWIGTHYPGSIDQNFYAKVIIAFNEPMLVEFLDDKKKRSLS